VKSALFKVVGASTLTWNELESLLLDVEITLNNGPLNYVEDEPVVAEEHDDAATEVMARPKRNTAAVAALRIRIGENDEVEYE
jgi:NAD dependent epimerase/dehydratase family enzyme